MYSLQRRRERYLILYTVKVIKGLVPNYQDENFEIRTSESQRRGRLCKIPPVNTRATCRMKSIVDASFAVQGPRLFNCLPKHIRDHNGSFESFKSRLDKFLKSVPDKPIIPGYSQQVAQNNSLVCQIKNRSDNNPIVLPDGGSHPSARTPPGLREWRFTAWDDKTVVPQHGLGWRGPWTAES